MAQGMIRRRIATMFAVVFGLAFVLSIAPIQSLARADEPAAFLTLASQEDGGSLVVQDSSDGWVKVKSKWVYLRHGKRVKGLRKIGGTYYYFNAKGIMQSKDVKLGDVTFYVYPDGSVFGAKRKKAYYYETLKRMPSYDAYRFSTYLKARSIIASIREKGDSKETLRRKAFDWVVSQKYTHWYWYNIGYSRSDWITYHARTMLDGYGGDCHGSSAAYAYLLAALGDSPYYCVSDYEKSGHAWVELGGWRYDPTFAKWQGAANYYKASGRGYYEHDGTWYDFTFADAYSVPWFSSSNAKDGAKIPEALLDAGKVGVKTDKGALSYYENGKKVRRAWRTIEGKRYYFKKNGMAAMGSARIDGVHYVFNAKGVLQRSTKSGVRTVKMAGDTYRVDKKGRAVSGWSEGKTRYFAANGKMKKAVWAKIEKKKYYFKANGRKATGPTKIGDGCYLFDADGVLLRGRADEGSLVQVGSKTYRVDKSGRAVPGWSNDKTMRFNRDGLLLKGIWPVKGSLYAADADGAYLSELTAKLKAASKEGAQATALRRLLGKPKSEEYSASCNFAGDDGVWEYEHFYVLTERPSAVSKLYGTIEDAIAAEDAGEYSADAPCERIASIIAR